MEWSISFNLTTQFVPSVSIHLLTHVPTEGFEVSPP